ncbi:hypothetical protein K0A97_01150 [Patescibacteria group bacterium]|nr:hypothetical protein [Patescibacteria group bacterium]
MSITKLKDESNKKLIFRVTQFELETIRDNLTNYGASLITEEKGLLSNYSSPLYMSVIGVSDLENRSQLKTPIKSIFYHGICNLKKGDRIAVTLCPLEEKISSDFYSEDNDEKIKSRPRQFNENEQALKIELLSPDNLEDVLSIYSLKG